MDRPGEPGGGQAGPADDRGHRVDLHADQGRLRPAAPRGQEHPGRAGAGIHDPGRAGSRCPRPRRSCSSMTGGGVNVWPRTRLPAGPRSAQKASPSGSSPARIRSRAAATARAMSRPRAAARATRSCSAADQPATRAAPSRLARSTRAHSSAMGSARTSPGGSPARTSAGTGGAGLRPPGRTLVIRIIVTWPARGPAHSRAVADPPPGAPGPARPRPALKSEG